MMAGSLRNCHLELQYTDNQQYAFVLFLKV